ncbi:MAG: type II secretion system F family protein [Kiritimatiellia bacterium]
MLSETIRWLCLIAWGLTATGFIWCCLTLTQHVTYVTLADGRQQERRIPLLFRLLLPFAQNFDSLIQRPAFDKKRTQAEAMLVSAGFDGLISGSEFAALQFLIPICGIAVSGILARLMISFDSEAQSQALLIVLFGTFYSYFFPIFWLRRTRNARHREILRALPYVLDLLTLSVESGLDFMSALQRNCERRKPDAINEELIRMTREIQIGTPRRTALKAMANRVQLPELKTVVHALVQADELGVSIGAILRIQSDQMRQRRFERAEALANKAPVKMLGPLMLCIFPATIIILLGPILLKASANAN